MPGGEPDVERAPPADKAAVALDGVPETMFWPLWNRAAETRRADRLIDDPLAVELVDRIDYDFAGRFGKPSAFHPIRARVCDDLIRDYAARAETPVVVALGEGLETQAWRLNDIAAQWITVDLPEAIDVRNRLLPPHPRAKTVACSALDDVWISAVPTDAAPFISAAGLLMYFEEDDVAGLLRRIADRFPGAEIFFDTITPHVSAKSLRGWRITPAYALPPMPWGVELDKAAAFIERVSGLEVLSVRSYVDPYPKRMRLYRLLSLIGPIRRRFAGGLAHAQVMDRA